MSSLSGHFNLFLLTLIFLSGLALPSLAGSKPLEEEMSDGSLAEVFAHGVSEQGTKPINFSFDNVGGDRLNISGSGDLTTRTNSNQSSLPNATFSRQTRIGNLSLSGNAQQNLSSLININANQSAVQVLLNMNINIDSQIDNITQGNLADLGAGLKEIPR